jgi:hypothetical protein
MTIEVLFFDGCPSYERLLGHLPRVLADAGIDTPLILRAICGAEEAERERFLGSPTVRIDGRDIEPGAEDRVDYGLKCRVYGSAGGLRGMPPDQLILEALAGHQSA